MSFPFEVGIGAVKIQLHLLFEILAIVLGYRYYVSLRREGKDPISESNRSWILIGAAFGAFFLSRLLGALEDPYAWLDSSYKLLYFFRSKTIIGGIIGALIGVELVKYIIGEKHSSGDLFTFPLILAIMIGRLGCFSMGVYEPTYGVETDLPWGMDLGDGLRRHPVALYEILFLGLLWLVLQWVQKHIELRSGDIFKLFMIQYMLFRFFIEYIKPGFRWEIGLTSIQIACLSVLGYYAILLTPLIYKKSNYG